MIRELSPELARIAKEELNENPRRVQDDIQHLKGWIAKQEYLKARTDDQWLITLLRGCKFSLERVKKKLDLYYTLRTTAPDVTLSIRPTEDRFLYFIRVGTFLILPEAKNEPRFLLIRPGAYNPDKDNIANVVCILYYLVQILVLDSDVATVLGTKIIVDYDGITSAHITQASPAMLKKIITVCQDAMPLRLKGSHHVNMSPILDMAFTMIKGLLNEKTKQRIKIHKNYEALRKIVPKQILPSEYGGDAGSIAEIAEFWVNKVVQYKSWMKEEEKLGTDETKRPGKPKTAEDMFGVDGSFRKLDID